MKLCFACGKRGPASSYLQQSCRAGSFAIRRSSSTASAAIGGACAGVQHSISRVLFTNLVERSCAKTNCSGSNQSLIVLRQRFCPLAPRCVSTLLTSSRQIQTHSQATQWRRSMLVSRTARRSPMCMLLLFEHAL